MDGTNMDTECKSSSAKIRKTHRKCCSAKEKKVKKASKSGLVFGPREAFKMHKARKTSGRVNHDAQIIFGAALQCVAAEVLELAGNIVKQKNGKYIAKRHIHEAVINDPELKELSYILDPLLLDDQNTEIDDLLAHLSL